MTRPYELMARVVLRYGLGAVGLVSAERLAADPNLVGLVALGLSLGGSALVEWWTVRARKAGRAT